jgi:hypothetical protein
MNYDELIQIYDEIDEYIMDQQRESAKCDSIEQKIVHEARSTGASVALQLLMRYASLSILEKEKEREDRKVERIERWKGMFRN